MFSPYQELILTALQQHLKPQATVILGLSGGPDSAFLFHHLLDLHNKGIIRLIAAHLNHQWRSNADKEASFCRELCNKNAIPFHLGIRSDLEKEISHNGSQEELGRNMRRHFFETLQHKLNADAILLAHHHNDQEETFFIRLIRGSTLYGLCSMSPYTPPYLRPLLSLTKEQILTYLTKHHLTYCHDETNQKLTFLRNKIRHTVLPALHSCDQRFNTKFATTLSHLQKENSFLEKLAQQTFLLVCDQPSIISLHKFFSHDEVLQKRMLIIWLSENKMLFSPSNALLEEILRFLRSPRGGTHTINTSIIIKKQGNAWLEKKSPS